MSNLVTRAAHSLKVSEKRLLYIGLGKTNQLPARALNEAKVRGITLCISAAELAHEFDVSLETAYHQLKSATDTLWNRYIRYLVKTPSGLKEQKLRWVSSVTYHHGDGWVEVNLTPEVAPHVLGLRKRFTQIKLKQVAAFDSIHAWRLYELLMSWISTGIYNPTIAQFHHAMEAPEAYRKNFKDLRVNLIEPAVRAINEKSDLLVQWSPCRSGSRKVTDLKFTFKPNDQMRLPLEARGNRVTRRGNRVTCGGNSP